MIATKKSETMRQVPRLSRLEIERVVQDLYVEAVLPNIIRPMALGFRSDEIRFMVRSDSDEKALELGQMH